MRLMIAVLLIILSFSCKPGLNDFQESSLDLNVQPVKKAPDEKFGVEML
ncbi:hypothetical protein [Sphingobacterium sp.]